MKKAFFKKSMALFLTVLMVMSCWVWVAPEHAHAATAGNYKVKITWQVNNKKKYSNSFTGTETEQGARAGIILYYKTNNGTGTEQKVYWDIGWNNDSGKGAIRGTYVSGSKSTGWTDSNTGTDYYCEATIAGFPSALFSMADSDSALNTGEYTVKKLEVYSEADSSWKTLWSGSGYTSTTTKYKWWKITPNGNGSNGIGTISWDGTKDGNGDVTTTTENWKFPTPTTATTYEGKVDNVSIPKSGTADVMTVKVIANDQYGVQMFTPTWSVKGSVCDTTGISVDPATADETTVKLTNAANVSGTTDTQTGTITATWGNAGSLSDTFTITDTYYTATFNYQTQNDDLITSTTKTETREAYHGDSITAPTPPQYYEQDYLKTFSAWDPTYSSTLTKDVTYTATYDSTFVEADYTDVTAAIAAVNAVKTEYGDKYENKFTQASRSAVESAINAVVYSKGRTQQAAVNAYADAINAAREALEPNKFDVIFLDRFGAIILYDKNAEFETNVTPPAFPEDQKSYQDAEYHYTYAGWDTDEYTNVIDDLVIAPVFTAEAHDWKIETVTSTCVQAGTTKYTCKVCGFVKYGGGDQLGDHVWEDDFTVDVKPTCTLDGSKSIHCTLCDARKDETVVPRLGHQWGSMSSLVGATCANNGIDARICDDCGICEHVLIPALEHNYTKTTVPATCTSKGYDEYTCQNGCGASYRDNYTDTVAHNYGAWETVSDALCGVPGVKKQTCTECGYVNIGSIDALQHSVGDLVTVVAATCTGKGYQTKTCSLCNNVIEEQWLAPLGHNYVTKTVVAPTCTANGYTLEECNRENCGAQRITNETAALNHAWTSTIHEADCTHSSYIEHVCANDASHNYTEYVNGSTALLHDFTGTETVISKATCIADGSKTVQCKNCDATTTVIIPKLGHSYGEWDKTTKPATNDEDGEWTRTCANCDDVETLDIPKGGHNLVEDKDQYVAPKCNEYGKRVYVCDAHENCSITVTVELGYAQHTVAQKVNEATCTEKGSVIAYCTVCDAEFSETETAYKAHAFTSEAVAPTCTTSGYTKYTCACGFSYNEYDATKPATGHSYVADETTAADCVNEGTMTYTCECGDSYSETIPAKGHSYDSGNVVVQAQSCTDVEKTEYSCDCGASYVAITKEAKGHTFGDWTETQAATADKYGIKERSCACGATEIAKVAPIGDHEFTEEITKNPSCTDPGSKTFTCTKHENCAANYTEEIPATGHTQEIVYTAPGCITEGSSKVVCTKCNAVILSEAIPAKGHAYNNVSVTVEAGCTTTGTRKYACDCGESYTESIPAKGHDLVTTVTDAKCGEKGSVVTSCSRCGYSTTTELAQKGHIWKDTFESQTKATCEADGEEVYKCQNCDATNTVVLPKLGHDWGAWVVVPSTNDTEGSISRTCSRGCTESVPIPAGGHKLVVDEANSTEATCSAEGKTVYKCENHTDCGITLEVATAKKQHTVTTEVKAATCKANGYIKTYCTVCSHVISDEPTEKLAHVYAAGTPILPTCTTSGYTPYTCSCGDTYNMYDEDAPAKGHTLIEGSSTADCDSEGKMTLTCADCTYTTTVDVPALGHDYAEDTSAATDATCALPATKTYKCLRCTDSYTVPVGNKATEHTWGAFEVKQSSTNTSIGYQTRKCTVCGQLDVEIIPATGEHNFNIETGDKKAASCTEDGYIVYACSTHTDCGLTSTVTLPKLGHRETLVYTAATCDNAGSTKMVCATCDATIGEEKVIPALGHLWNDGTVTPANCTTEGKIEYTCTRDGCTGTKTTTIRRDYLAHDYVSTILQPSCTKEGSITVKCSREGCPSKPVDEKLAKKEHNWGTAVVEDPTCVADGSETYTCLDCDATNTVVLPKLGHTWGDWYVSKQSTNTDKGELKRECTVDDCTAYETIEFPAGGHSLVVDVDNSNDATCTAEGKIAYKCENHTDCGITLSVTTAKKQHELVKTEKMATCEADGSVVTKCKNCDTATFTTVIPKTGHSYVGEITKNASCTEEGVMTYTCAHDSNHIYTVAIAKTQHNYQAGEAVAPTCKDSGYTPYNCADCESAYVLITAPAKGHSYIASASGATCTAGGTIEFTCACGEDSFTTDVPALGHDYVLSSTTDATCAAAATETYKCSRCTDSYTVSVGAKTNAHDFDEWVTVEAPTNTSLGYKTRTCKVCGKLEVETIPATGEHVFDELVSEKKASCTATGEKVYKCTAHSDCGETSTIVVPATGHTEALNYTAATCTAEGSAVMYCSVCNDVLEEEIIPMLGHTWANEQITLSTCKQGGKVEFSCTCGETKTVDLPVNANAHNYTTVIEDATCKEEGSIVTKCTICGDEEVNEVLPKLQHTWGEWTVQTPATNTAEGVMIRVCGGGCTETATFPAGGHAFKSEPDSVTPASCTATGTATYKCTAHANCGVEITVTLDKVQHTLVKEIEDATCTTEGFVKVYCNECGEVFANVTTAKTAHEFEVIDEVESTCTSSGYKVYKCKNCTETYNEIAGDAKTHAYKVVDGTSTATCTEGGVVTLKCDCGAEMTADVAALGHDYVLSSTTDATCAAAATETYKCSRCTASYTISVGDKTDAHKFGGWTVVEEASYTSIGYKTRECSVCGKLEVETIPATGDHNLVEIGRDNATCTADGKIYYKCDAHTDCGVTDEITIPATGHSEKLDYKAATCTENGYSKRICIVDGCGETLENVVIPATGHAYNSVSVTVQPGCLAEGEITYTCACGDKKTAVIPAAGHTLTTTTQDATCENEGSVVVSCSKCTYKETTVLAAKGHIWADTPVSSSDATCDADGSKTYKCTNCDKENTVVVAKLGHKYVAGEAVAPTCTTSGYTPYTCDSCGGGYNVYDASKPATGHSFKEISSVNATCTDDGSVTYKCENCTEEKTEITPKLGHDWNEWTITTQPTATTEGVKTRECSRGCKETVTLPKLGHEMVKDTAASVAPTCTADGEDVYVCKTHADCGYTFKVTVAALGHSFDGGIETSAPTCENDGVKTYTCACGETKTEIVPKTGHTLDTKLTPAKCEENGKVETNCTKCSFGITTVLVATGHVISVTTVPATCTAEGSVTEKCEKCNDYTKTTVIDKLAHDFSGTETVITDATCTEDGEKSIKCKYCDAATTAIIPHLGHTWGPWTETAYGEMTRTCSRGECTESVSIPNGGHVMGEGVITKQPTCQQTGIMTITCKAHTACGVSIEITLDKLQHTVSLENSEATCDTAGTVRAYCSDCGTTLSSITTGVGQHKWDNGTPVAPTCSTSGYTLYVCQHNSAHVRKEYDETKPAIGHADKAPHDGICDNCSQVLCEHKNTKTETANEVANTCTKDGSYDKTVICTDCYAVISRETVVVKATGKHVFENYIPDGNATCGKDGTKTAECIYGCGETDTVKDIGSEKQHKWSEWKVAQNMTCTSYEILTSICSLCGETKVAENYKKGFAPHSYVIIEGRPATCLAPGATDYTRCVVCNRVEGANVIPQLQHKDTDGDNKCDMCEGAYIDNDSTKVCDCMCHKSGGFMQFIYKFMRFFWKLFGINRSCECGATHY